MKNNEILKQNVAMGLKLLFGSLGYIFNASNLALKM